MNRNLIRTTILMAGLAVLLGVLVLAPKGVNAGVFNGDSEVTYKEYWVDHSQFTGGCNADGSPTHPFGTEYLEPWLENKCLKTLAFNLPDDFTNAARIELFLDLWKNYDEQAARFRLNGGEKVYAPPVGFTWSRTPYITEIDKSELNVGANTISFWGSRQYQLKDLAIRIYHDDQNPLVPAQGGDTEPPDGELVSIEDDSSTFGPGDGGVLMVNDDQLKLTAEVSEDTAYVEFHAWYEGYDLDNDGNFREWQNLSRNNWWPGGKDPQSTGGTINHIGTVKPKNGVATVTWTLPHVTNQPVIKFKIRIVDNKGNVREAADGVSDEFALMRDRAVSAFIIHGFNDFGLHMFGNRPDSVDYDFDMPLDLTQFDTSYILGNYWRSPTAQVNYGGNIYVNSGTDSWELGIKEFTYNNLKEGRNRITYNYTNGIGHFIERPGPKFVLSKATGSSSDNTPPFASQQNPAPDAQDVSVKGTIMAHIGDLEYGVDYTTIRMRVDGQNVTGQVKLLGVMGDYLLVYDPPGNMPTSEEFDIELDACDLVGNCMDTVAYSFTTEAPDEDPPVISNIVVATSPNGADISWTTDEPATSKVRYGKTTQYELGTMEDEVLKTSHSLSINGLIPDTLHHFRVYGTDEWGNEGQSGDETFTTDLYGDLLSDDFNSCSINTELWEVVNPGNTATFFMNGEQLSVAIPTGNSFDWKTGGPPRLMQVAPAGNFGIDVKFNSAIAQEGQSYGLVVEQDADTFVFISYEITANKGPIMFARFFRDGQPEKDATLQFDNLSLPLPDQMRLRRVGDTWDWFYTHDDGATWKRARAPYDFAMTALKVGVFSSTNGPAFTSLTDFFFNMELPIIPEDAAPMSVNVEVDGNGQVTKSPDMATYVCGDQVTLNATPDTGWQFDGWGGDIESPTTPVLVEVDGPKHIVASFSPEPYLLDVTLINNGTGGASNAVVKNPDQPTYIYGDAVELTAAPEPGWSFVAWSGALTGSNPVQSITMFKDEAVTATFLQDQYELNVEIESDGIGAGGEVTISPQKATYVFGDVVRLTAVPELGWTFTGWTGGVTSSDSEIDVVITGDTDIKATFVQDRYDLTLTIVHDGIGEGGTVLRDPEQADYVYGDLVVLTAEAAPGWNFTGWGGALVGDNPVEILEMTGDLEVTATFEQEQYMLDVETDGSGNVKIEPNKTTYVYGDEVKLTALPAPNFFFIGWQDDLSGAVNPVTITIMGDTLITARFSDNPPPTVDPIADEEILIGEVVAFEVTSSDPDDEPITLTAMGLPEGATFEDNGDGTGSFSWRPGVLQVGEYEIVFTASDGEGLGSAAMTVTVTGHGVLLPIIVRP